MVAPSLTHAGSHSKLREVHSHDDTSLTPEREKHDHGAIYFVTSELIDSSSEGRHGSNYCNGGIKGPNKDNRGTKVSKEHQINVEECGIHAIKEGKDRNSTKDKLDINAMCQEDATKISSKAHDMAIAQRPMHFPEPIAHASVNTSYASKGKRVQWNDNHGKELVQVFEYGLSDTGESEEDEDNTDTCTCAIQ